MSLKDIKIIGENLNVVLVPGAREKIIKKQRTLLAKDEEEGNLQYVERILQALMSELEIEGVALALKTKAGNDIFTCKGNCPHFKVVDHSEWEDYWGNDK